MENFEDAVKNPPPHQNEGFRLSCDPLYLSDRKKPCVLFCNRGNNKGWEMGKEEEERKTERRRRTEGGGGGTEEKS